MKKVYAAIKKVRKVDPILAEAIIKGMKVLHEGFDPDSDISEDEYEPGFEENINCPICEEPISEKKYGEYGDPDTFKCDNPMCNDGHGWEGTAQEADEFRNEFNQFKQEQSHAERRKNQIEKKLGKKLSADALKNINELTPEELDRFDLMFSKKFGSGDDLSI